MNTGVVHKSDVAKLLKFYGDAVLNQQRSAAGLSRKPLLLSEYVPPHDATPGQNVTQRRSQAASGHEISGACSAKIAVLGSGGHWFRA
jgi:hypothetical protein